MSHMRWEARNIPPCPPCILRSLPRQPSNSPHENCLALAMARRDSCQVCTRQSSEQRPVVRYLEMQQLMDNDLRPKACRLAEEISTERQTP